MGCIRKFRSPNVYDIITVTKIKKGFLKKKEWVKVFFVYMTMLSIKEVESSFSKKEPYERGSAWIIKFSHLLNFGYHKYGIIIFSIRSQNGCTCCTHKEKICEENNF